MSDTDTDLLVRTPGSRWRAPGATAYGSEDQMQELIAAQPSLLPGVTRGASAIREMTVPGFGFVDVVVVGSDGRINLVECKLASNPEIRRTVVGQVLAYAAGTWGLAYEDFDDLWRARTGGTSLVESVLGADPTIGVEEPFRKAVTQTLENGDFALVFAVDAITEELRQTVSWLNEHTTAGTSCVAFELAYAKEGDVEIIRPRTFGSETARAKTASASKTARKWSEAELHAWFDENDPTLAPEVRRLVDHFRPHVADFYLGDGKSPSITFTFDWEGTRIQPISVYTGFGAGVAPNFDWMKPVPAEAKLRLIDRLGAIPGAAARMSHVAADSFARRPTLPFDLLRAPGTFDVIISAFDELLRPDSAT